MSRLEISNDKYLFAFGVDRVLGCFFQIWDLELSLKDEVPSVKGDEKYGIKIHKHLTLDRNPTLKRVIEQADKVKLRSEEEIIKIGRACGIVGSELESQVFELWD